jgi:hypothetical protein
MLIGTLIYCGYVYISNMVTIIVICYPHVSGEDYDC